MRAFIEALNTPELTMLAVCGAAIAGVECWLRVLL
jgi:hypothetical protein